jgi:N-acyl-D-aspartate/D-glutamate deacylase
MYDTMIKGGTIVDGEGGKPFTGDIGVKGGKIAAIGKLAEPAKETIDADGLIVAPGWVDIHTHYDGQATWDPLLSPSSNHGVTTAVFGNCGVGFAPVMPDKHEWLIGLMEGVEDIPGTALSEGMVWEWETFPEYLDALERRQYAMDIGSAMAHGALRAYVMGERGANNEDATPEDIAKMAKLVREAQAAGAFGVSTSRTVVHLSKDGVPVPGTFAKGDELFGIASEIAKSGHGLLEWAAAGVAGEDGDGLVSEMDRMLKLAVDTKCPITFLSIQTLGKPDYWREQMALCDQARAKGARITAQTPARGVGLIAGLKSSHMIWSETEIWQKVKDLPFAELVRRLQTDNELRAAFIAQGAQNIYGSLRNPRPSWDSVWELTCDFDYEPKRETSVGAMAHALGKDPREVALDLMLKRNGENMLINFHLNYANGDLDAVGGMLEREHTVAGGSDGGAHVGMICDASMPTYLLTHWARDRKRGKRLPIEFLVKKQTADTADLYGLRDRGRLVQGLRADLNLIDFERLSLGDAYMTNDLPAGAPRLMQGAKGYVATMVAGAVTRRNGVDTGARPGRLVRSRAH